MRVDGSITVLGMMLSLPLAVHAVAAQEAPERTFTDPAWEISNPVPGQMDSPLLRPGLITADENAAYLFDYGDGLLKAFHLDTGELFWSVGRQGGGPGEFNNPTSIQIGDDGSLWVLDPPNVRISRYTTDGELLGSVRVEDGLFRLGSVSDGRIIAIRSEPSEGLVVEVDTAGTIVRELAAPAWAEQVPAMAAGVWAASDTDDGTVAMVFPYSGRALFGSAGAATLTEIGAVETQPEPEQIVYSPEEGMTVRRLTPEARMLALSITMTEDEVWILVSDEGEESDRVVDRYDRATGAYISSWRLPRNFNRITAAGDRLVGIETDMFPALFVLDRRR